MTNYKILSLVLLLLFSLLFGCTTVSYGESPAFVRQEVDDGERDLFGDLGNNLVADELDKCGREESFPSIDIKGISYISDKKFINSTVWLTKPFKPYPLPSYPTNTISQPEIIYQVYQIGESDSSTNLDFVIKALVREIRSLKSFDLVEITEITKGKNYKLIFTSPYDSSEIKFIWFLSLRHGLIYLQSFQIRDYSANINLSIVNKLVNSTDFIQYDNNSVITYENPNYGIKVNYPFTILMKNFKISTYEKTNKSPQDWQRIFWADNEGESMNYSSFSIIAKNRTIDFDLNKFRREMIEYYGSFSSKFVNDSGNLKLEKLIGPYYKNSTSFTAQDSELDLSLVVISTFLTAGDKMYSFVYESVNKSFIPNLPLYTSMLNSAEFLQYDNNSVTTYENPNYGIKLKYPINWNVQDISFSRDTYSKSVNLTDLFFAATDSNRYRLESKPIDQTYYGPIATFTSNVMIPLENKVNSGLIYYYMLIDITSAYDKGTDYAIQIQRNESNSKWDRYFVESSSSFKTGSRLLHADYNVSDFYDNSNSIINKNFITFSLDLQKINNPDKYKIMIGSESLYDPCNGQDISQLLPVPPPSYDLKPALNGPLFMYPNDEKILDLRIDSNSPTSAKGILKSISNIDMKVNVTFSPSELALEPAQAGFSKVKITTKDATLGSHTIPLTAEVTFSPEVQFNLLGESRKYSNPVISNIPLYSNLTITVESVPPFYQPILEFSKNVIEPFGNLATATIIPLVSAAVGLMVYLRKRHSLSQPVDEAENTNKE